jgi:hypothetical protein
MADEHGETNRHDVTSGCVPVLRCGLSGSRLPLTAGSVTMGSGALPHTFRYSVDRMESRSAPTPHRFNEEDAPLWVRSWWKAWIWSRQTLIEAAVRSPIFVIERRGLLLPVCASDEA